MPRTKHPPSPPISLASLIPLHKWAESLTPPTSLRQVYRWRLENRIIPDPVCVGRNWFVMKNTKRPKVNKCGRKPGRKRKVKNDE